MHFPKHFLHQENALRCMGPLTQRWKQRPGRVVCVWYVFLGEGKAFSMIAKKVTLGWCVEESWFWVVVWVNGG